MAFAPAIPWAIGALEGLGTAAWAWATSTAGMATIGATTTVVVGAAVVKKVNENADAKAAVDPNCPECKPGDKERCEKLRKSMENKVKELEGKRTDGLANNPQSLPWDKPGGLPRESVVGHIDLFDKMQGDLAKQILEFEKKKCGKLPDGAMKAVMKEPFVQGWGQ